MLSDLGSDRATRSSGRRYRTARLSVREDGGATTVRDPSDTVVIAASSRSPRTSWT